MVKARMKWTSEKPTEPGWYWYKGDEIPITAIGTIYLNADTPTNWMYAFIDGSRVSVTRAHFLTGEWSGPIHEPTIGVDDE